jgi:Ca2+-binding EF-hand superfamily protein
MHVPNLTSFLDRSEKKFHKTFAEIDVDGGGEIDFDEMLVWWAKQKDKDKKAFDDSRFLETLQQEEQRLRLIWNMVDADASGQLDEDEAWSIFTAMGMDLTEKQFHTQFRQIDSDGGGHIEFDELLEWWKKQKHESRTAFEENAFQADKDDEEAALAAADEPIPEANTDNPEETDEEKADRIEAEEKAAAEKAEQDELDKIQTKVDQGAKKAQKKDESAATKAANAGKGGVKGMFSLVDKAVHSPAFLAKHGLQSAQMAQGLAGKAGGLAGGLNPLQKPEGPKYVRSDDPAVLEKKRAAEQKIKNAAKTKMLPKEQQLALKHAIQMPVSAFLKGGIEACLEQLRPLMTDIGGRVRKVSEAVKIDGKMRSTMMRRRLSHLLQELLVDKARSEVFPILEKGVLELGLPSIAKKIVIKMAIDFAEETMRKAIHDQVINLFDVIQKRLVVTGTVASAEGGEVIEEDEFGFPLKDGGLTAFRAKFDHAIGGLLEDAGFSPMDMVHKIIDRSTIDKVTAYVDQVRTMLEAYEKKVAEAKRFWLENEGGAKELAKAKGKPKKMKELKIPIANFQKAGLEALLQEVQPHLETVGGKLQFKVEKIMSQVRGETARAADLRRGLDQTLQAFVLSKVVDEFFPVLEAKIAALNIPSPMIADRVVFMVKTRVETMLRTEVHGAIVRAYASAEHAAEEEGTGALAELGRNRDEDECGFLLSEGGYKQYQRDHGVSIIDQIDDLKDEIVALQAEVDTEALAGHGWRVVFEKIKPVGGDSVMTVDDFKFQLSSNGMLLSDEKFQALVNKIDRKGTGALNYDEFAAFFLSEEHELEIKALLFGNVGDLTNAAEAKAGEIQDDLEDQVGDAKATAEGKIEEAKKAGKATAKAASVDKKDKKTDKKGDGERDGDEPVPEEDEKKQPGAMNVRTIWAENDDDGTGNLVIDDIAKVMQTLGKEMTGKDLAAAFKEMDMLSGGKDGEVNFEQFASWWSTQAMEELEKFAHLEFEETKLHVLANKFKAKTKELKGLVKLMATMPDLPGMPGGGGGGSGLAGAAAIGGLAGAGAAGGAAGADGGGVPDLGITIPTTKMLKDSLMETVDSYKAKIVKKGGLMGEKAEAINFLPNMELDEVMLAFSQLLQVTLIDLARKKIVPVIEERIDDIGLPGVMLVKKVKSIVYEQAEKILRKQLHATIMMGVGKIQASLVLPGCAGDTEESDFDDYDECGFLLAEGGYKAARYGLNVEAGGDPGIAAMIAKVIDPKMVKLLKDQLGIVGECMQSYGEGASTEWKKWMKKTGKPAMDKIHKTVVRNEATEEPTPKGEKEEELLAAVLVPTEGFHKKGPSHSFCFISVH